MKNSQYEGVAVWLLLWLLIACISLFGCSPEKRIARILKHHPELIKTDTVWKVDTIITGSVQKDSSFYFYQKDTIFINNGKLQVKYFFNRDSTVYLSGKCNADTIIKYYPITTNQISVQDHSTSDKIKWSIVLICLGILLFFLLKR